MAIPTTCDHPPRPAWCHHRGFHQPTSDSSSLLATHDYCWCQLGSTSNNCFCRSAEYAGEAIPHHPSLSKADLGHWWASFFFRKSAFPFMATVFKSSETMRKQPGGQPGKANTRLQEVLGPSVPFLSLPLLPLRLGRLHQAEAVGFFYIK
ncbi:unnamed protein product [Nyctereutes procyonoides]|uniref:(raccoon dog) hypothetical protein n=1 Tax=Nyctereutes procyonoides TaxID=34880 RepID=A0A811Y9Q2_NYCPR|nr:unnamed protein product [Nyctereutes procyonoides]